ncbi:MAG: sialate O-acetylesterase, partial [Planctomycetaceae bacterium]|nr:sialate O-acetylesterase [Planctomycetaceae bacterium]
MFRRTVCRFAAITVAVSSHLVAVSSHLVAADLELPAVFSDHMVVQRDQPIRVWGWADAGARVTCQLSGGSASTMTDADGRWKLQLDALPAGGPFDLTVTSGDRTLTCSDVLIGEVWLCSGQSNMAMTVNRARDFEQESAAANYPKIRM